MGDDEVYESDVRERVLEGDAGERSGATLSETRLSDLRNVVDSGTRPFALLN